MAREVNADFTNISHLLRFCILFTKRNLTISSQIEKEKKDFRDSKNFQDCFSPSKQESKIE